MKFSGKRDTQAGSDHQKPQPFFSPSEIAARWRWNVESVRRAIRQGRIASTIIGRRRLIPAEEIDLIEREGFVARAN